MKKSEKVESNKIDLKEVNKTKSKKTLQMPQIANPLKKQKGPKRDEEGKFASTTGGGGLSTLRGFDFKRALPLIAVITLVGGFFVYRSFAATPNYGAAVTAWYSNCKYSPLPQTTNSGYIYWKNRLAANPSDQDGIYKAFAAASKANGKPNCPATNPYRITVPTTPPTTPPPTNSKPPTTTPKNYLASVNEKVTHSQSMATSSKAESGITDALSKKQNITQAEVNNINTTGKNIKLRVERIRTYKTFAQDYRNKANSDANTRSQVLGIDTAINLIDNALRATNTHYENVVKHHVRGQATVDKRKQEVATPAFITPTKSCKDGFYGQPGKVSITYKIPGTAISKTGNINAVTCNKNKYGLTPKWDVTKGDRVCSGLYKAYRVNQTMTGTGYKAAPPNGWVCYRGNASDLSHR